MSIHKHLPAAVEYAEANNIIISLTPRQFRIRKLGPDNAGANRLSVSATVDYGSLEHTEQNILLMWMQEIVKRLDEAVEEARRGTDDNRKAD